MGSTGEPAAALTVRGDVAPPGMDSFAAASFLSESADGMASGARRSSAVLCAEVSRAPATGVVTATPKPATAAQIMIAAARFARHRTTRSLRAVPLLALLIVPSFLHNRCLRAAPCPPPDDVAHSLQ
jgi:hypothetical protein